MADITDLHPEQLLKYINFKELIKELSSKEEVTDLHPELLLKHINVNELKRAFTAPDKATEALESFVELCCKSSKEKLGKYYEFETDDSLPEGFIGVIKLKYEKLGKDFYQYLAVFYNPSPLCHKWFYDVYYKVYVKTLKYFPEYFFVLIDDNNVADGGIIPLSKTKLYTWHNSLFSGGKKLLYLMPLWAKISKVAQTISTTYSSCWLDREKYLLRWAMCTSKLEATKLITVSSDYKFIIQSQDCQDQELAYWVGKALDYVGLKEAGGRTPWDLVENFIKRKDFEEKEEKGLSCFFDGEIFKNKYNSAKGKVNSPNRKAIEACFKDE